MNRLAVLQLQNGFPNGRQNKDITYYTYNNIYYTLLLLHVLRPQTW